MAYVACGSIHERVTEIPGVLQVLLRVRQIGAGTGLADSKWNARVFGGQLVVQQI
jgi:hypothetical protein